MSKQIHNYVWISFAISTFDMIEKMALALQLPKQIKLTEECVNKTACKIVKKYTYIFKNEFIFLYDSDFNVDCNLYLVSPL